MVQLVKKLFASSKEWCFQDPALLSMSTFFKSYGPDKAQYLTYVGYLFASLAYADKSFSKSELIEIETVLDNELKLSREESQAMSSMLKQECKNIEPQILDQVVEGFCGISSQEQKQKCLNALRAIASSDTASAAEQEFLRKIENALGPQTVG